jgi:hypothetical protein
MLDSFLWPAATAADDFGICRGRERMTGFMTPL